eukprot:6180620-Pleurochrysis_carterae.AAC.2
MEPSAGSRRVATSTWSRPAATSAARRTCRATSSSSLNAVVKAACRPCVPCGQRNARSWCLFTSKHSAPVSSSMRAAAAETCSRGA